MEYWISPDGVGAGRSFPDGGDLGEDVTNDRIVPTIPLNED